MSICINMPKIKLFLSFFLEIWLKNLAIWLAENILAYMPETRIFPNMEFAQKNSNVFLIEQIQWKLLAKFFNKLKKSCFWGKNFFQKIWLCHAQLYMGFIWVFIKKIRCVLCQSLEKTNDTVPRKHADRLKDRRTDEDGQILFFIILVINEIVTHKKMARYSIEPKDQIFLKGYELLYFTDNMSKNTDIIHKT